MSAGSLFEQVDVLLSELDKVEPVAFDLGTPQLPAVDAVYQLAAIGPQIVPHLLERARDEASKKRIAYIVMVLGLIRDDRALEPLQTLRVRYQQQERKDEWDYAITGQCNLALERLQGPQGPIAL